MTCGPILLRRPSRRFFRRLVVVGALAGMLLVAPSAGGVPGDPTPPGRDTHHRRNRRGGRLVPEQRHRQLVDRSIPSRSSSTPSASWQRRSRRTLRAPQLTCTAWSDGGETTTVIEDDQGRQDSTCSQPACPTARRLPAAGTRRRSLSRSRARTRPPGWRAVLLPSTADRTTRPPPQAARARTWPEMSPARRTRSSTTQPPRASARSRRSRGTGACRSRGGRRAIHGSWRFCVPPAAAPKARQSSTAARQPDTAIPA